MGLKEPLRLRGVGDLFPERRMRDGFKRGGGGCAFAQRRGFRRDGRARFLEHLKRREVIISVKTGEIIKRAALKRKASRFQSSTRQWSGGTQAAEFSRGEFPIGIA